MKSPTESQFAGTIRYGPRAPQGNGAARMGNARYSHLTEKHVGSAKSVVHFDVQGSVAKSTHAARLSIDHKI